MSSPQYAPRRTKQYMIGCMLIEAINEASAQRKYERTRKSLEKRCLRERAERIAWLEGEPVSLALRRLTAGQ